MTVKITYTTGAQDLAAFVWYHNARSPMMIGMMLALTFLMTWNEGRDRLAEGLDPVSVGTFLLVASVYFSVLFLAGFAVSLLTMVSRRNRMIGTESTLVLDEDVFSAGNAFGRSEMRWNIVLRIRRSRRHLFIYLSDTSALVVPRRAFADDAEWSRFDDFLRAKTASTAN